MILLVFRAAVVRIRKTGITVVVLVAFILDLKVISSVGWPRINMIINCMMFFSLNERHFFPEFELQQERTARRIGDVLTIFVPLKLQRSECGDGSVEFGADDGDSVWGIVAVFVEGRSRKVML